MPASQDHMQFSKAAFGCFKLEQFPQTNDNPPRKRAKFTPQRRKEVALLRGKACLRCRLLKLRCSGDNPCQTCLKAASVSTQSKHLQFSYCIRTSLKDLSIFGYSLPPQTETETIVRKAKALISASIELNFPLDFEWNLSSLSQHVSSWLVNPAKPLTSKVGILCSTGFQRLLQAQVGLDLSHSFRQMLFACTTAYNQDQSVGTSQFSDEELRQITSVAGECVLVSLERRLTPAELEKCTGSLEYSQALFLILLGTILAVGYMQPIQDTPTSAYATHVDTALSKTLYESVQEHLCATLAHYMIYLGHKTTTTFDPLTQEHLITKAHERWQAQGHFQWTTPMPFRGTSGDSDSRSASASNSGEERSTLLVDYKIWNDALEEFGQQEGSELCIHHHVRGCSYFWSFPTDTEGVIEDHHLPPPVGTQDTFAGSAGIGVIYDPAIAALPDQSVGYIPTTNVFDFLKDTRGPISQSAQFSSPEIISNSPLGIMINSSVGLSSTLIRQPAVEKSGKLVERLDTPSGEMPSWTKVTLGSSAAWKETVNLDQKQVTRKRAPLSPETLKRACALRQRSTCISCKLYTNMCSPYPMMCGPCKKTNYEPFQIFDANNNLLHSHLSITMIELEKRSNLVYYHPRTLLHTNELRSGSSERLTAGNTTFDHGLTKKSSSQTSQQDPAKRSFTTEDIQAPLRNLPPDKQHIYTNRFSGDLIMLTGEEGANRLIQEPNLLYMTVCSDVDDQYYNWMRHFEAGGDGVHMANIESISQRLLV